MTALIALAALLPFQEEPTSDLVLRYVQPAATWNEALPVGNGRLGAMVFGHPLAERIQLNEDSMWAGSPREREREGAAEHLDEVRRLLFAGEVVAAQALAQERFMSPRLIRSYQTLGDLSIEMSAAEVSGYERALDLDTAVARATWSAGGVRFERQVFASAAAPVLVVRLEADRPGAIDALVGLSRAADGAWSVGEAGSIAMSGQVHQGTEHPGVKFAAELFAETEGGRLEVADDRLRVAGADALTLLFVARTDFAGEDPEDAASRDLERVAPFHFDSLREDHVAEHRRLFGRVELDLGSTEAALAPTDVRLERLREGGEDPQLFELYFQYGRYLLLSSSRPGGLPANLQGLWNEHLEAPWNSDYHVNINLQMNYWPAEVTNLAECTAPLFDFVERLAERGRRTARVLYDCDGWVAHHTSDAWAFTVPTGRTVWGLWPLGGAWMTRHMWEHFEYGGDGEFLLERALPALRGACAFFLDYLVEDPNTGLLVAGPMSSPENVFVTAAGARADVDMGPAMGQQIVWDLFTNTIAAADAMGIEDEFTATVAAARERLAPTRIGEDGRLLEWSRPYEEAEPGHRHMSHLYALHPGSQITPRGTPELAAAARKSLSNRLEHGGGHTGWSRAWLVNFHARLLDGEGALEHLRLLLTRSTLPNLFDNHPPFQIDGNLGGTAGIAEMLLQSHAGEIELLPALPHVWSAGSFEGLRARGGFTFDVAWDEGAPVRIELHSALGRACTLRMGSLVAEIETEPGTRYLLAAPDWELERVR